MTREIIEDYRKIVLPFMKKKLLEINYENQGESDADEFEKDFNEISDLAAKALEQEPRWIPVSEKLPKRENSEQFRGWYLTTNAYGSVGVTKYEFESGSFGFIGWGSDIRIVAWMPLPQPYTESGGKE